MLVLKTFLLLSFNSELKVCKHEGVVFSWIQLPFPKWSPITSRKACCCSWLHLDHGICRDFLAGFWDQWTWCCVIADIDFCSQPVSCSVRCKLYELLLSAAMWWISSHSPLLWKQFLWIGWSSLGFLNILFDVFTGLKAFQRRNFLWM